MPFDLWLAFVAAATALLLIPGPTVLLVLSYALSQGRRVAAASAAGVATGDLAAMSLSLAGLGTLVATSAAAFTVLKWVGAAYLIWLGIGLFRAAPGLAGSSLTGQDPAALPHTAPGRVFRHTALVTALNPKSIAFFIAFVPQFVDPARPLGAQFAILTATFVTLAAVNALAWALAADRLRAGLARGAVRALMARMGGGMLVVMGLATAVSRRPA